MIFLFGAFLPLAVSFGPHSSLYLGQTLPLGVLHEMTPVKFTSNFHQDPVLGGRFQDHFYHAQVLVEALGDSKGSQGFTWEIDWRLQVAVGCIFMAY